MLPIFNKRRVGGKKRPRKASENAKTDRYKHRARYDNLRVGNIGEGWSHWTEKEEDLLLRDMTHREIVFEIFRLYGIKRSRGSILARCKIIKDKLKGIKTKKQYKAVDRFIERHKLTLETFRPFDELHMYGYERYNQKIY